MNRNCLSYWFPKLVNAGLPVPRTAIIQRGLKFDPEAKEDFPAPTDLGELAVQIQSAAADMGIAPDKPFFLRTGQGSGKHQWKDTCFVPDLGIETIAKHVSALIEWSQMVDFMGLPFDVWCVREMIPTEPITTLPRYGDMPLVPERRFFVAGGKIVCSHAYWPWACIFEGLHGRGTDVENISGSQIDGYLHRAAIEYGKPRFTADCLASSVAKAFENDGSWSVDILADATGKLWVTDMAEAGRSFHLDSCPKKAEIAAAGTNPS